LIVTGVQTCALPIFVDRLALIGDALPEQPARALVDRVHQEAVSGAVVGGVAVAVEAGTERRAPLAAHRARHEEALAPDDGAGMRQSRDGQAPPDVLTALAVPGVRKVLPVADTRGLRPSKRGPAVRLGLGLRPRGRARGGGAHDPSRRHARLVPGRAPGAAVEDDPARRAAVRDEVEAQPTALEANPVAPRTVAAVGSAGGQKLDRLAVRLPGSLEGGPAITLESEGPVGREARGERPERDRRGGDLGRRRGSGGGGGEGPLR